MPTGHRVVIRTGLPAATWRLLNQGILSTKSRTAQVDEGIGMLEAWSEVDKDLAMLNGNTNEFRLSEATAFIEAMNQEFAQTIFYGNSGIDPEEFLGFAPRYNLLSAENGQNIIDGGGTGSDNSSIWLVVWGQGTVYGVFPKGSQAGLIHDDLGEDTAENVNGVTGAKMRVFRDRFQWKGALVLKDWRYTCRICNIDISNLVADTNAADITTLMIKALHRIHNIRQGKAAFYMNRSIAQYLDLQRLSGVKSGGGITFENVDGKMEYRFRGIPIRIVDALTETEARIV